MINIVFFYDIKMNKSLIDLLIEHLGVLECNKIEKVR